MRGSAVAAFLAVVTVAGVVGRGTAAAPPALPPTGLAVQTGDGVTLIDLHGRVLRSLPGFSFRAVAVERPGQIELRDSAGSWYELRSGSLLRRRSAAISLPGGYALRFSGHWALLRHGEVVEQIKRFTHLELDSSGAILSLTPLPARVGATTAPDLRTGTIERLPRGCRVGARLGSVEYQLCGYPYLRSQHSSIVRANESGRRTLVGPAQRRPQPPTPAGSWQSITPSPDGRSLLAQWSGECETPTAYRIDIPSGRLTILGHGQKGEMVESHALGWNGNEAIASLPHSVCISSTETPGIYAFNGAKQRLIYPLPTAKIAPTRLWK